MVLEVNLPAPPAQPVLALEEPAMHSQLVALQIQQALGTRGVQLLEGDLPRLDEPSPAPDISSLQRQCRVCRAH